MHTPPLECLYEDEWMIAVNKPAGQLVHPADHPQPDDIVTMKLVRDYLGTRVYAAHRLDRPTCGVLIFAKGKTAARALGRAFDRKQVSKIYQAIVTGQPTTETWTCCEPLRKDENAPAKEAITDFRLLKSVGLDLALLEALPRTGRYHQIRKHLQICGHPIVGDFRYAGKEFCHAQSEKLGTETRMLLQCKQMELPHPVENRALTIKAPIDPCFEKLLKSHK
ncbi:RluA family pseudouridine synthase [Roseibacillus persicicus]|uniref:RluA family pseudouridine synthase n=1 Tax=Roseibacillus persicicus TaxID=454148 RepID=UPI00398B55A1